MMDTLFAQKVASTDTVLLKYATPRYITIANADIILSRPNGAIVSRISWHYSGKPDKRNKSIMFNCQRYALLWLPDSPSAVEDMLVACLNMESI